MPIQRKGIKRIHWGMQVNPDTKLCQRQAGYRLDWMQFEIRFFVYVREWGKTALYLTREELSGEITQPYFITEAFPCAAEIAFRLWPVIGVDGSKIVILPQRQKKTVAPSTLNVSFLNISEHPNFAHRLL